MFCQRLISPYLKFKQLFDVLLSTCRHTGALTDPDIQTDSMSFLIGVLDLLALRKYGRM
jgi:hypothetical protein